VLRTDEIVTRMRLPIPAEGEIFKIYKNLQKEGPGHLQLRRGDFHADGRSGDRANPDRVRRGRARGDPFAAGRGVFVGQNRIEGIIRRAGNIAGKEVTPISDVRGSEGYRRTLAKNIMVKFWQDIEGAAAAQNVLGAAS